MRVLSVIFLSFFFGFPMVHGMDSPEGQELPPVVTATVQRGERPDGYATCFYQQPSDPHQQDVESGMTLEESACCCIRCLRYTRDVTVSPFPQGARASCGSYDDGDDLYVKRCVCGRCTGSCGALATILGVLACTGVL